MTDSLENPKVSIIIPNHNYACHLKQCLDSILNQTYKNLEIVVVDDASTDSSRVVIDEYANQHSNIIKLYLDINQGVSNARNQGAKISKGEYIEFIDSDDFFYTNDKIQNEIDLIQAYLDTGKKIMAYSCVACVNEQGEYIENRGLIDQLEGNILAAYIAGYKDDKHARNVLFDRALFFDENCGQFDTTMSFWEDSDLFIRMLFHRKIFCTHKLGTAYRWKTTGLSHNESNSASAVRELEKKYRKRLSSIEFIKYLYYKVMRFFYRTHKIYIPEVKHQLSIFKHFIQRDKK